MFQKHLLGHNSLTNSHLNSKEIIKSEKPQSEKGALRAK